MSASLYFLPVLSQKNLYGKKPISRQEARGMRPKTHLSMNADREVNLTATRCKPAGLGQLVPIVFLDYMLHPKTGPEVLTSCNRVVYGPVDGEGYSFDFNICYFKAITSAPATINNPPVTVLKSAFSPKKIKANTIAKTTPSLSTGATLEAGPSCKAR